MLYRPVTCDVREPMEPRSSVMATVCCCSAVSILRLDSYTAVNRPLSSPASSCVISVPNPRLEADCWELLPALSYPVAAASSSRSFNASFTYPIYSFWSELRSLSLRFPSFILSPNLFHQSSSFWLYMLPILSESMARIKYSDRLSAKSSAEASISMRVSMKLSYMESKLIPVSCSKSPSFSSSRFPARSAYSSSASTTAFP